MAPRPDTSALRDLPNRQTAGGAPAGTPPTSSGILARMERNPGKTFVAGVGAVLLIESIVSSQQEADCLDDCLPSNYTSSEESGLGTLSRDQMEYKSGDKTCQPVHENCMDYCAAECDVDSWAEMTAGTAGDIVGSAASEAGDVAGEGLGAFLDGFFGEGMGVPAAIAIFIFIVIIMMAVM